MGTFHNELIIENDIFSHFAALAFSFVVRIIFLQTEIQCRARHESHISRSERNWCNSRSAFLHLLSSIKIWSLYWWMLHIVIRWKNVETLLQRVLLVFQRHWCYVMYFSLTYYLLPTELLNSILWDLLLLVCVTPLFTLVPESDVMRLADTHRRWITSWNKNVKGHCLTKNGYDLYRFIC